MKIGARVKSLRSLRGLSQNELAKRAGVTQATLSRLESGISDTIRGDTAIRLAQVLGTSLDYLMGDREKSIPSDFLGRDPEVDVLVEDFSSLNAEERRELIRFARFLRGASTR